MRKSYGYANRVAREFSARTTRPSPRVADLALSRDRRRCPTG